jgi:hypothetical protein
MLLARGSKVRRHTEVEYYEFRLLAYQNVQSEAGRMAEMLAYVADGFSQDPEEIDLSPNAFPDIDGPLIVAEAWPSLESLQTLRQQWREAREALRTSWLALSDEERRRVGSFMEMPRSGLLQPVV